MKFNGSVKDLEMIVTSLGRKISSSLDKRNMHQIKTLENETINLYKNNTMQVQGKSEIKEKFENDFSLYNGTPKKVIQDNELNPQKTSHESKEVFIVHGHDTTTKEQLELVLHKLGLEPFVLANTGGQGLTIIEALESKIGTNQNQNSTSFGIVLMTPDDMGYAVSKGEDTIEPRARQNVVLEMGMLISSIGRKNIAILIKGHLEKPSDFDGILYIAFNAHVKETIPKLVNRLKDSGFILSPDHITNASS
jgi:predicted nucleotide-binding protein